MALPEGWDKRIRDLKPTDHGDGRLCITGQESVWAREYERRLLRPWARFPHDGDVYEATEDVQILYVTHWRAPFTGGGEGVLPKGTRVRVEVFDAEPVAVYAQAENASELECLLVPEEDRQTGKYSGYSLSLGTEALNRRFRLVHSNRSLDSLVPATVGEDDLKARVRPRRHRLAIRQRRERPV